jgi:tRNA threonylcarbamoyladenosine biosynthesis protein TsaE
MKTLDGKQRYKDTNITARSIILAPKVMAFANHSNSPDDTIHLGEVFCSTYIRAGSVITVRGELGAGKTHFIKGIARALGIDERELTSPTFSLAHEFDCSLNGRPFTLYHLDCYRFERAGELLELGVEDYLYPKSAATIIEWPERIEKLIPDSAINVQIISLSETEREIAWDDPRN